MKTDKIGIGCDHAGFIYKESIKTYLQKSGYEIVDYGTHSEASVDYPDFVHPLAAGIETGAISLGFLICGSANGVAITANKHQGVRAAIAWKKEIAELARLHNDANVLCIPARFVSIDETLDFVNIFLTTIFEGGRHQTRVSKIPV